MCFSRLKNIKSLTFKISGTLIVKTPCFKTPAKLFGAELIQAVKRFFSPSLLHTVIISHHHNSIAGHFKLAGVLGIKKRRIYEISFC
jgi:hypothetical protein